MAGSPEVWPAAVAARMPESYIVRSQPGTEAGLDRRADRKRAVLVVGPRQAGKSTWLWKQIGTLPPQILVVNCEVPRFRDWCSEPAAFLADVAGLLAKPALVLLEEVQHLSEAALFIKGLVDRGLPCPLVVTGSSSFELHSRTRESLAGRARRIRLLPLSLAEISHDLDGRPRLLRQALVRERLGRHMTVGGYPAVWTADDPGVELAGLVEAFVLRDASDLFRIERPDAFRTLLALAARQVGSTVNFSEWASIVGVSVPTVISYLAIMEESHLVVRVPIYAGGKRAELTSAAKIYFVDCGLRNRLVNDFSPLGDRADAGALLENWVFSELHKSLPFATPIGWWRTKAGAEVDFVVRDGARLVAIEVKALAAGRPVLSRGARSFLEAYAPARFLVATLGLEHTATIDGATVEWVHASDLVERVRAALGG